MAIPLTTDETEALVVRLRMAGCVFAEEEATLLVAEADTAHALEVLTSRRVSGEPLEYVLGWADFGGRRLAVTPGVFVPRHRSEFLAAQALDRVRVQVRVQGARERDAARAGGHGSARAGKSGDDNGSADPTVLDLCCGAGAVAVTIAATLRGVTVHAADIDPVAVACARRNLATFARIPAACHTWTGDLFAALPASLHGRVDVIVANAPYVPTDEIALLPPEARLYEATATLDGGADGLAIQRRIAEDAGAWLAPGGYLLIETSERQATRTHGILTAAGLAATVARSDEWDATVVIGMRHGGVADIGNTPPQPPLFAPRSHPRVTG